MDVRGDVASASIKNYPTALFPYNNIIRINAKTNPSYLQVIMQYCRYCTHLENLGFGGPVVTLCLLLGICRLLSCTYTTSHISVTNCTNTAHIITRMLSWHTLTIGSFTDTCGGCSACYSFLSCAAGLAHIEEALTLLLRLLLERRVALLALCVCHHTSLIAARRSTWPIARKHAGRATQQVE